MLFILLFNDAFLLPIISIFEIWSLTPSGFHLNQPQEACWCTIYLRLAVPQLVTHTTVSCTLQPPHLGYFHLSWLLTPLGVAPFTLHTLVIFTLVGYSHHCELQPSPSTPWLFSPQLATHTTVSCSLHPPHLGYFHLSWLLTPLWVAAFTLHTLVIFTPVGYSHHCELHPSPSTRWLFSPQLATHTTVSCTLHPPHVGYFHLSWLLTPLSCTLHPPHDGYFHLSWLLTPLWVAAPFTLHTLVVFTSVCYLHHWIAPLTLHTLVIFTSVGYLHHCELHPSPSTRWLFSPQLATYTTVSCSLHPPHLGYFHLSWLLTPLGVAAPFTLHTLVIFTSVGYLHHCELLHPSPSTRWLFSPQLATYTTVSCTLHPPHIGYFHLSWLPTPLWVAPFTLHTLVIFTSVGYLHHCELHPSPSTRWLFSPQLATYTTVSCSLHPPHLGYFHLSWLLTPLGVAAPFTLHTLVIFTSVGYLHHWELLHPSPSTRWLFSPQLATYTTVSCSLHPPHLGYFHLSWLLTPLWVAAPFTLHTLVIFTSVGYSHHCELQPSPSTPWLFSPQLATYTTVSCTLHPPHVGYFHLSWLLTPLSCTLHPPHLGYFHLSWLLTPLGVAAPFNLHILVIFTSVGYLHHCELHPSTSTRWLFSPQLATYTTVSCTLHPRHIGCFHPSWLLTPLWVAAFTLHTLVIFTPVGYSHHCELHPSPSTHWLFSPQLATYTTVSCTLHPPHVGYFHLSWLPTPLWVAPFTLHTLVIFTSVGYLHHCELQPSPSTPWLFSPQLATYTTVSCCTLHPPHLGYFHLSWLLTPLWVAAFTLHTLVIFTSVGYLHHCELHPSPSTRWLFSPQLATHTTELHPSPSTPWLFSPQLATYTTGSCCTLQPPHLGYFHLSWLPTPLWVAPFNLHTLVIFTSVGYLHHCELHPSPSTRWLFSPQLATHTTVSCSLHPPHLGYFHPSWLLTPLWVAPFTLHTLVIFTSVGYLHRCELLPHPPHVGYFHLSWLPTPLWAAPLTLDPLVVSGRCRRSTSGCARRTTRTRTAWRGRRTGTAARVATTRWSPRPGCCGSTRAGSRPGWRSLRTTTGSSRHSCSGYGSC